MTSPARKALGGKRRLAALAAVTLTVCAGIAYAQPTQHADPAWYSGTVNGASNGTEHVMLDVRLFDDGFAFGRLQIPQRDVLLLGSGRLRDGVELRLTFREPSPGEDPYWAAELAHLEATSPATVAAEPARPMVAVLKATRDFDWANEGTAMSGTLRWSNGEPAEISLERMATATRWTIEQGRIESAVIVPYFYALPTLNAWLERQAMPAWRGFAAEGREVDIEGVLGWGWYREERWQVVGMAGEYISLLATIENYTGGAHPNTFHHAHLVRVGRLGVEQVELPDLFGRRTRWLSELSDAVLADLRSQDAAWVVDGQVTELDEDDLSVFTLDATGLTFHFSPYLMGPYVQGTFRVTLPYGAVVDLAAEGSPLRDFAADVRFAAGADAR